MQLVQFEILLWQILVDITQQRRLSVSEPVAVIIGMSPTRSPIRD